MESIKLKDFIIKFRCGRHLQPISKLILENCQSLGYYFVFSPHPLYFRQMKWTEENLIINSMV